MLENKMGGACGTDDRPKKQVHTGFWWGDLRERDHLEDLGVNGNIILLWILKKSFGSVLHWPGSELG
jgi:hypothetical protein